jgi:hypothetical protein
MAQTGFTPISIYYSATSTNVPTAGNLVAGELAINTADGKLFYKDSSGVVQVIGTKGGVGSSTTTQVLYNSSGLVVGSANLTFNGTTLTLANDASISGLTVGKGAGSIATNVALGQSALAGNSTGLRVTAIGNQALLNNTASENTGLGARALLTNTSGANNTAVGRDSMYFNTTGGENAALGLNSLLANTTGSNNTAIGRDALQANTTASNNVAVGYQAGYSNTTGGIHAFGRVALYSNTTGVNNAGFGNQALFSNTTGGFNTAFGDESLRQNTTASRNTAVGFQAGYSSVTGTGNVFIGSYAGYTSTATGNTYNVCVGDSAGFALTSGTGNTFIGTAVATAGAGGAITTGSKNTIIGGYSGNQGGLDIRTASNYIVLSDGDGNPTAYSNNGSWFFGKGTTASDGYITLQAQQVSGYGPIFIGRTGAIGSTTDQWYIGSNSNIKGGTAYSTLTCTAGGSAGGVNLTSGATSWASASDERLKNVTGTYTNALADIAQIKPVKFTWKSDAENKPQVGVIAQSVIGVVPEAVDSDVRASKDDETEYMSVRYTELIPLMIASIQELKAEVDSLKQQLGK